MKVSALLLISSIVAVESLRGKTKQERTLKKNKSGVMHSSSGSTQTSVLPELEVLPADEVEIIEPEPPVEKESEEEPITKTDSGCTSEIPATTGDNKNKCLSNAECKYGKCMNFYNRFLDCDPNGNFGNINGVTPLCDNVSFHPDHMDISRQGGDDDCVYELSDAIFGHPSSTCEGNFECAGYCRVVSNKLLACDDMGNLGGTFPKLCDVFILV